MWMMLAFVAMLLLTIIQIFMFCYELIACNTFQIEGLVSSLVWLMATGVIIYLYRRDHINH